MHTPVVAPNSQRGRTHAIGQHQAPEGERTGVQRKTIAWLAAAVALVVGGLAGNASAPKHSSFAASPMPVNSGVPAPTGPSSVGVVGPDVSPTTAGLQYFYADSYESATATGAVGTFLVEDPTVSVTDFHSLAEMSVQSSDREQTVEVGWIVDPGQFGDTMPHLFVFHWVNGSPGCYDGCGFVPTSTTITAGMVLTAAETDVFEIAYANSNWNIYDNGTLVGYFPGALWSGTFTSFGLTQWFGEVAAGSSVPCSQMGRGAYAGANGADTINDMGLVGGPRVSIATNATNNAFYTAEATSSNSLSFGGPGGCATLLGSSTAITSTVPSNPVVDQAIEVNVSVTGPSTASGATTPTGWVTISDDQNSCQATLSGSNGTATGTCSITVQAAGNYSLNASYPGDENFSSSATPASTPLTVGATSTTALKLAAAKVTYGNEGAGHLSVTVSPELGGSTPTGTVTVHDSTTTLCTIELSLGQGSCVLSGIKLVPGAYRIVASYGGSTDFDGSTSAKETLTVTKATSKTGLKLSAAEVTYRHEQVEHLSVAVSPRFSGSSPTGKVTIGESGTALCVITLSAGKGSCMLSANRLNKGIYHLSATYGGSANLDGSMSAKETLLVDKAATKTVLTLSTTTVTYGQEQTERLSVVVSPQYAGTMPTGMVTVRTSATTLCRIALSSGKGSCRLSEKKLNPDTYGLVATYGGSTNFKGSTSAKENLTVAD